TLFPQSANMKAVRNLTSSDPLQIAISDVLPFMEMWSPAIGITFLRRKTLREADLSNYFLNRYPTPQIVSINCGLDGSSSIFSLIFLIWTVTVVVSPIESYPQIRSNKCSLLNT